MNVYTKEPQEQAKACMIWMHGLGSDANDMMGLVNQLPITAPLRHVFMDAPVRPVTLNQGMPMRAWYDILGTELTDREDEKGIKDSQERVREVIATQLADGFLSEQIFLAGFSQGGALSLVAGLEMPVPLAGLVILSAYWPLASACQIQQPSTLPIFMTSGNHDHMVWPAWTRASADKLREQGFQHITWHEYERDHSVCIEEANDLGCWIDRQVIVITESKGEAK